MQTPLFVRQQPGGMFSVVDVPSHPGNVWFVNSACATGKDAAGYGQNPDAAFLTLDYAVGLAAAGDVIYLMPGHTETVATAGAIALDVAGITVIGLGLGASRPTFTFNGVVGADINISGAGIKVENILCVAGLDGLTNPLHITGADVTIKDCEWRDTTDVEAEHVILTTAGAARLVIDGGFHNGFLTGNACHASIQLAANSACTIKNSRFQGVASVAFINIVTALTGLIVRDCTFRNVGTALTKNVVDTATGSTWAAEACYDQVGSYAFVGGDGAAVSAGVTASVASVADGVLDEALTGHLTPYTVGASFACIERACEKADGAVLLGNDALFTISGGPIEILSITGIVTTNIGAGATNVKLQLVTTTPAATVDMNAGAVDIDGDVAGTSYRTINTTGILTPVTAGFVLKANAFATNDTTFLAPIGSIQLNSDAARAGVIAWYLRYRPLSPNSKVVAAA
jgi:hypothetical protein